MRWASMAEAGDLMPDMAGVVREHLEAARSREVIEPEAGS
jgi:hypothetical protein